MEVRNSLALLTPDEERITGYSSPVATSRLDVHHIYQTMRDRELDFFDPDKSPTGNSIERWHELQTDREIAHQMIVMLGGIPLEQE